VGVCVGEHPRTNLWDDFVETLFNMAIFTHKKSLFCLNAAKRNNVSSYRDC